MCYIGFDVAVVSEDKQRKQNKRLSLIVGGILGAVLIILVAVLIRGKVIADKEEAVALAIEETVESQQRQQEEFLISSGYVPLVEQMEECGYALVADADREYTFHKKNANMDIHVIFDMEQESCSKNEYDFDLTDSLMKLRDVWYIREDKLDAITNRSAQSVDYSKHPWTDFRVIAHAGGGYRDAEGGYFSNYTNSYEAMVQNYNLGCRVFEFDFALTTDGRLAAVHDWKYHGNMDGDPVSSEEWDAMDAVAKPATPGAYTTIFVEDILDQMLVNEDMYMVTDVKFEDLTEEEVRLQFDIICQAAVSRDASLLNRIVPQIYSEEMYDWLMDIYPFPSVIFTCYKTDAKAGEIIDFCASKDNIHVITTQYEALPTSGDVTTSGDGTALGEGTDMVDESGLRFSSLDIANLHSKGLLIYNYTVSSFTKMYDCMSRGVDGIYSNNLLPQDFAVYDAVK
ncbi:MAG: glycerophosphodiester phosphodiesterase family protein [Lachnospiraceae bacterium]|nr:glycerophosphodiester phosphodiesterase family protein [Lachnospiraceae bacterium]